MVANGPLSFPHRRPGVWPEAVSAARAPESSVTHRHPSTVAGDVRGLFSLLSPLCLGKRLSMDALRCFISAHPCAFEFAFLAWYEDEVRLYETTEILWVSFPRGRTALVRFFSSLENLHCFLARNRAGRYLHRPSTSWLEMVTVPHTQIYGGLTKENNLLPSDLLSGCTSGPSKWEGSEVLVNKDWLVLQARFSPALLQRELVILAAWTVPRHGCLPSAPQIKDQKLHL